MPRYYEFIFYINFGILLLRYAINKDHHENDTISPFLLNLLILLIARYLSKSHIFNSKIEEKGRFDVRLFRYLLNFKVVFLKGVKCNLLDFSSVVIKFNTVVSL